MHLRADIVRETKALEGYLARTPQQFGPGDTYEIKELREKFVERHAGYAEALERDVIAGRIKPQDATQLRFVAAFLAARKASETIRNYKISKALRRQIAAESRRKESVEDLHMEIIDKDKLNQEILNQQDEELFNIIESLSISDDIAGTIATQAR